MELIGGIFAVGPCVWIPVNRILVLSDLHLGFEESLVRQGVLIPKSHWKDLMFLLGEVLKRTEPQTIVVNGDIKNEFGTITRQEWDDISHLIDFLRLHCKEIIFVKGNHDTILKPIAEKKGLKIVKEFVVGKSLILHGNTVPESVSKDVKNIIVGHAHSAIRLRQGVRTELFKCFLVGTWKKKNLVVIPSMNPLLEGSDVLQDRNISPFLSKSSVEECNVFVVDGVDVLRFGKLKELVE
ncbi:metallophosphoesterase [Candidatus Woesearchaeota archaeon]|nr:metallophosphoesterase [Candidatus Woesearchaeota archaeon]